MPIARRRGVDANVRALASQVHPVFMAPPLAASGFGALLAFAATGGLSVDGVAGARPTGGLVHVVATFFAVYTAHVKDGYVDFYRRGEDDDHPMTARGCRVALVGATVGFAICLAALWSLVDGRAVLLAVPMWVLGYLHAPHLDTNPATVTLDYPVGFGLAILGGFYVQAGSVSPVALGFAGVFVVLLAGVKVVDDVQDLEFDRAIDKRTVAVVLGPRRARRVANGLVVAAGTLLAWGSVVGLFPASSLVAFGAFAAFAWVAGRRPPTRATELLIRGASAFLVLLVVAVVAWPLAGASLPAVTALGPYTYLATEIGFGAVALALLVRSGALWRALRTVVVLYPVAYLWDWYTLSVGVFSIPMRTGVEVFAVPLEEHVFMVVVPALVVGVHETIH